MYSDTRVTSLGTSMLHVIARPRSLEREELPKPGREERRLGGTSGASEEPPRTTMNLPRRR